MALFTFTSVIIFLLLPRPKLYELETPSTVYPRHQPLFSPANPFLRQQSITYVSQVLSLRFWVLQVPKKIFGVGFSFTRADLASYSRRTDRQNRLKLKSTFLNLHTGLLRWLKYIITKISLQSKLNSVHRYRTLENRNSLPSFLPHYLELFIGFPKLEPTISGFFGVMVQCDNNW